MKRQKNIVVNDSNTWNEYYKNKSNLVPREALLRVLDFFERENSNKKKLKANDLGSGHGSDTIELLKRGWKVTAIDSQKVGLDILKKSISPAWKKNLKVDHSDFKNVSLSPCDLLNANFSLPFCNPNDFNTLWKKIKDSIVSGGRFSGNFFGKNDEWADNKTMTFHSRKELDKLFESFQIESFRERDEDGKTSDGADKHWHEYAIIAKKK